MKINAKLTRAEAQVAELLAWGADKKTVADMLCVSYNTISTQARSIFRKLNIQKSTELSVWYFCTRFHISFDLSPLSRRVVSIALLLLTLASLIDDKSYMMRAMRSPRAARTARVVRRAKKENEVEPFNIFLV